MRSCENYFKSQINIYMEDKKMGLKKCTKWDRKENLTCKSEENQQACGQSSQKNCEVMTSHLSAVLTLSRHQGTVCGYATVVSVSVFDYCDCAQSGDCNSHWTPFGP
ncbi:hypothetical protein F2P81_004599 [Scophthalmus maximus]|uniref:Uncharacterized protein n=1 Tax=Scophthalmus maximus TaxID=52904 RepID=A0A6A4TMP2_SCOMX|nr:hypothetical protein F2P81_004599 [Scophthalmus maximus]